MKPRKLFIAGASGATGQVLVQQALQQNVPFVAHYRPTSQPPANLGDRARQFDLGDAEKLKAAMAGATTVLQLIGTTRKRFARGDTYASSDIATTQQLADAARATGVDHFLVLSALGAGMPLGAYLQAKARAEAIAKQSGIPTTVFRPSAFIGKDRTPPPGRLAATRLLGLRKWEPIRVESLSAAMLRAALARAPLDVILDGGALFELGEGRM